MSEDPAVLFQMKLSSSDKQDKLKVLSILAHAITVEIRLVFISDPRPSKSTLYAMNEIQHTITGRLTDILYSHDRWKEEEFVLMLYEYGIEANWKSGIDAAIQTTLTATE